MRTCLLSRCAPFRGTRRNFAFVSPGLASLKLNHSSSCSDRYIAASTVSERRRGQYLGHRLLGGKQQGQCPPGPLRISLSLFTRRQDPNLLFGPYNWNPPSGSKEYCSWDGPNNKVCNHHQYDRGLISLVHNAGAEIYPSLGGWTLSDPFPAMSASAPARSRFAENCVDLIKEYGFDGIDIDWEVSNKMALA